MESSSHASSRFVSGRAPRIEGTPAPEESIPPRFNSATISETGRFYYSNRQPDAPAVSVVCPL